MKTMTKLIAIFALLSVACFGQQYTLPTTTLGAAVTSTGTTTLTLASTSTMLNQGGANQVNTCLYIDAEAFAVITVVNSTTVTTARRGSGCGGTGLATRPTTHASGATVYFAITQTLGNVTIPAPSLIGKNGNVVSLDLGSCTAASEPVLPKIFLYTAQIFDCLGGHWVQTNAPGIPFLGAVYTVPAGTIVPTGTIFLTDTGTNQATGIQVPHGFAPGMTITIIPGGAFTTTTTGGLANIRIASTAVAGKALIFTWDGVKFDPSY